MTNLGESADGGSSLSVCQECTASSVSEPTTEISSKAANREERELLCTPTSDFSTIPTTTAYTSTKYVI